MVHIDLHDCDELWLSNGSILPRQRDGGWKDKVVHLMPDIFMNASKGAVKVADRLCGTVFLLTDHGESEGVRLRQALPRCNFIYPQIRFRPQVDDPDYETQYERAGNRPAPFKMVMDQVTDDFRRCLAPYLADAEYASEAHPARLFWIDEEVYMLMKMKF